MIKTNVFLISVLTPVFLMAANDTTTQLTEKKNPSVESTSDTTLVPALLEPQKELPTEQGIEHREEYTFSNEILKNRSYKDFESEKSIQNSPENQSAIAFGNELIDILRELNENKKIFSYKVTSMKDIYHVYIYLLKISGLIQRVYITHR